ncbi:MAG TPA: ClpXP protease specificity-enhancing factor SspB [Xanthobacteraceae bacterium]|nr:ClpXP protease specificity-enhancing factor SspB [Xanthobacteraceae bacterium]
MGVDHIRYDLLAQEALRGVLRTVLADAAKNGLPGDHHFFVTFDTRAEGVRLSQRMRAQYPEEMTIVLQHQFWDLTVGEDAFEVGLSFGGVPERLAVPFAAVKGFFDPSVEFGLQFEQVAASSTGEKSDAKPGAKPDAKPDALPAPSKKGGEPANTASHAKARRGTSTAPAPPSPEASATDRSDDEAPDKSSGGEVVRLDRFRKK